MQTTPNTKLEALRQIGNEWQKNGHHRVYLNDLPRWYGLEITRYGTGNISHALLNGEQISNNEARKTISRLGLDLGKVYYDVADDLWYGRDIGQCTLKVIASAANERLTALMAAADTGEIDTVITSSPRLRLSALAEVA